MRGALIHGVLLVVMLVYGYRTWTRDKTVKPDIGSVVLWDKSEKDIVSIAFKGETREVKLEQRTANGETYWWGSDTTITKTPKPEAPKPPEPTAGSGSGSGSGSAAPPAQGSGAAAGSAGSGSAGSGSAGSGSGSAKPPEMIETRKVREFPLGEGGMKIVKNYTAARAIRDLGKPTDAQKKTYKLDAAKSSITITFKDGARTFQLGDAVYGNQDKYVLDDKGRAYVLSKDLLTNLELGEQSLFLADARGFDAKLIESVTIEGAGKVKSGFRTTTEVEGRQVKTWADGETKKPHPSLGNFIDQLGSLGPSEYSTKTKLETLTPIAKVTYKDGSGNKLGTLTLYKGEKPPTITPDMEIDPANPPRGETEYFIMTEKSRVPAVVRKDTAQQVETNLPVVMNEKPPEPGKSIDPKGNPFGNTPLPKPGAVPPGGDPHGHGAAPGGADPHGAPTPPPGGTPPAPGGGLTPPPGGAPGGGLAPQPGGAKPAATTPPAGSAAAPKPAAGSAAAPKPAAGSAAAPKPAAGSATRPSLPVPKAGAGSAAKPTPGSATAPKPATGSAAKPAAPP
jgi:hypothetical protein